MTKAVKQQLDSAQTALRQGNVELAITRLHIAVSWLAEELQDVQVEVREVRDKASQPE